MDINKKFISKRLNNYYSRKKIVIIKNYIVQLNLRKKLSEGIILIF